MQPACCRAPAPPGLLRPHCAQKRPIPRGPLQNWLLKGQTGKRLCQLKPLRRCNASLNGPRPPTWAPAPSGRGERPLGGPPLLWGGPQGGAIWGSVGLGVRGGGVGRPALGDGVICRAWGSRKHLQAEALASRRWVMEAVPANGCAPSSLAGERLALWSNEGYSVVKRFLVCMEMAC